MFKPAVDAIRARMGSTISGAPVGYPNEGFVPPDNATWVLLEVRGAPNKIKTAGNPGNRLFMHAGVAWAHIFVPQGQSDDEARTIADAIGTLFERKDIPAPILPQIVRTEDPSQGPGEAADERGKWCRISVSIPFDFFYFS